VWYQTPRGQAVLAMELDALRPLVDRFPAPRIEIGVGTGRFAQALDCGYGLDPSEEALALAGRRGITGICGVGEALPLASARFGAVLLTFTLCFLDDPHSALAEAARTLVDGGGVVVGFLPTGGPWAELYAERGRQGHPVFRHARFHSVTDVQDLLTGAGFDVVASRSTLRQPPGLDRYTVETAQDGVDPDAGYVVLSAVAPPRG